MAVALAFGDAAAVEAALEAAAVAPGDCLMAPAMLAAAEAGTAVAPEEEDVQPGQLCSWE